MCLMKPSYDVFKHSKYLHKILGKWIPQIQDYLFEEKQVITQEAYLYFMNDLQLIYKFWKGQKEFWGKCGQDWRQEMTVGGWESMEFEISYKTFSHEYNDTHDFLVTHLEFIKDMIGGAKCIDKCKRDGCKCKSKESFNDIYEIYVSEYPAKGHNILHNFIHLGLG